MPECIDCVWSNCRKFRVEIYLIYKVLIAIHKGQILTISIFTSAIWINCVHWTVVHGDVGGPMDSIWVRHHPPSNHRIILPQLKMIPPRCFILLCKLSLVAVAVQGFIGFGDAEFVAPHAVVCGLYHQRLHVCYRQVVEPACAKATASRPHYGGFALVTDPDPSSPARPTHSRLPMPL